VTQDRETVINVLTRRRRPALPRSPVLSSGQAPWRGLRVEQYDGGPFEWVEDAPEHHLVLLQLEQPTTFQWKRGGRSGSTYVAPRHVSLLPAMAPVTIRNEDTRGFVCVALEPTLVLCAAHDLVQHDRLQLASRQGVEDPFVRGTALALRAEIEAGYPGGRTYGELLANALAVHLVKTYSTTPAQSGDGQTGLSRQQLRLAIEWIHDHLAEDIAIKQIADEVGLSPFHFARLFKSSTGYPPHQYRIQRRLERAKDLLISSDATIAQIAVQVGFCDQSHFASHFKRVYGVTPKAFLRRFALHRACK
jgi:AraC family transcriptional regulator